VTADIPPQIGTPTGTVTSANVAVVGAGYVGLVVAAGLAELGARVTVVDLNELKVNELRRGVTSIYEPGLVELLARGAGMGRLSFTESYSHALANADFVMVCVPTPPTPDGSLDSSSLRSAYDAILSEGSRPGTIVVNKSTVPVGTADAASREFERHGMSVASNPEFLSAGRAVESFMHPSRIVVGARDLRAAERVASLYATLDAPIVFTDPVTAELSKLAANAFLAMKISFANALSQVAEAVGADGAPLVRALSLDPRIGQGHLRAGLGYGGSCLPKDLAAVEHLARASGSSYELFQAVAAVNHKQRRRVVEILTSQLGDLAGRKIGILGMAFKAGTDDVRESPGLAVARHLFELGAEIRVYDPAANEQLLRATPSFEVCDSAEAVITDAHAIVVATDWPEFGRLDFGRALGKMRGTVIVDGRGLLDGDRMRSMGFRYFTLATSERKHSAAPQPEEAAAK
jgi:UDPglucose 6-dehydrogenase